MTPKNIKKIFSSDTNNRTTIINLIFAVLRPITVLVCTVSFEERSHLVVSCDKLGSVKIKYYPDTHRLRQNDYTCAFIISENTEITVIFIDLEFYNYVFHIIFTLLYNMKIWHYVYVKKHWRSVFQKVLSDCWILM